MVSDQSAVVAGHPAQRLWRRAAGSPGVILVFGGNGQLGQDLMRAAASRAITMRTLSRGDADIADNAAVTAALSHWNPSLVVNAAAHTKVDLAETDPEATRRDNEVGPGVLASACAKAGVAMVHISTDYVFDGTKEGVYLEGDPVCPINVNGRTKAAGENEVRRVLKRHLIVRTAWVYSEFDHNFLKTVLRLAAIRDELRIVADQYGSPAATRRAVRVHTAPRFVIGTNGVLSVHKPTSLPSGDRKMGRKSSSGLCSSARYGKHLTAACRISQQRSRVV